MVTSNKCWLKNKCYKYLNNESAECKNGDIFCIKLFKINELYDLALLSDAQKKQITLITEDDPKYNDEDVYDYLAGVSSNVVNFVKEGRNLFIYSSNVGNGKTSWSIKILQSYLDSIWADSDIRCRGLFINVPKFFLALKDSISNDNAYIDHIKKNVLTADVVVWDEIGTKSLTSFEFENLLSLIDSRINSNLSNIYTSNIHGQKLEDCVGDRLYSRIVNLSTSVEFKGRDKRGTNV